MSVYPTYEEVTKKNLVFFRQIENPDYYIILFNAFTENPKELLNRLNHTGKYANFGFPRIKEVDLVHVMQMTIAHGYNFLDFIATKVASGYFPEIDFFDCRECKSWCELKVFEPEKWEKDYWEFLEKERKEYRKRNPQVEQLSLF